MRKNRLLKRGSVSLILVGLALLIINLVGFPTSSTQRSRPNDTLTQTSATKPPSTISPTRTQQASVLASPTVTIPKATIASPSPTAAASSEDNTPASLMFDGDTAYQHVLAQVALGPRPTGTEAGWATGDLIIAELEKAGWPVEMQEFVFQGITGRNIIAKQGSGPIIVLGAHYDTRPAADREADPAKREKWIDGANDGASGVAVLLEMARVLEFDKLKNEIWLAFFDAEDRGRLDGWPFSVGARYMAENLKVEPQSVVVVDMIGDADQNIFFEQNSTEVLSDEIWAVAAELGYEAYIIPQPKHTIIDDHLPFIERGIPAVDMIDFDYAYWHTLEDTADKVAPESLERVGRTLEVWLEEKQQ